ncbi:MAG: hypothetical protein IJ796_02095 [Lachnospiraceae bacterium]|nr:hypothetical protein [Lachnospiraceae bacterium]
MSHGWQGGSIAVYGEQTLYRVEAVTASSLLKRTNEDGRQGSRNGTDREDPNGKKNVGFAELLATEAGKKTENRNVRVQTNGYTKLGVPTAFYLKMRDYTYQN